MAVIVLKEKGDTLEESFEKIFKKFNYSPKGRVFIKPNFSGRSPIIAGENTDPKFLEKFTDFLVKKGADEVIIGHCSLLGTPDKQFPFDKIISEGGFSFLREKRKVRLLDLDKEDKEETKINNFTFSIPKIIRNADSYINLAKLKTHMETTVTFSLKNQMGLVSASNRINMHKNDLEDLIAQIGKLIKPTFSIVDGIISMEGNGPHNGESRKSDMIIAGDDTVELDSVTAFLIGIDFKKVKHILIANRIGAGNFPTENYLLSVEKYRILDFKLAAKNYRFGKNLYLWPTTSCSRCITAVNECGKIIKRHPIENFDLIKKIFFGNKRINIVLGKADDLQLSDEEKIILIGQCTKCFANKKHLKILEKCPPSIKETLKYIKKELNE
jgi:uncharacterized protein (DUF362 family)